MVYCPACEANMDLDDELLEEGGIVSCEDCGAKFEITNPQPLELNRIDASDDEDDDEDLDEEDEDGLDEDEDEDEDFDDEDQDDGDNDEDEN
ncbi:MAG: hypothetical protein ACRD01_09205 [Terriglobales bacterium]